MEKQESPMYLDNKGQWRIKSDKPTEAQIKEFWEWCGFRCRDFNLWTDPNGQICLAGHALALPIELDLNNLFRYAVLPFLDRDLNTYYRIISIWHQALLLHNQDPALALFWAIFEIANKDSLAP